MEKNKTGNNNEKILNAILQSLPSLVSYIDRELVYRYVNDAYLSWFGMTKDQCLGKHCSEVLGVEAVKSAQTLLDRAWSGETIHQEKEIDYKISGRKFVQLNFIPDFDVHGTVQGIFVIVHDISSLNLAERTASRKSTEFERMINTVGSIIAQWDKNLICVAVNNTFAEVFGVAMKDVSGKHFREVLGEEMYHGGEEIFRRVLSGETVTFERDFPNSGPRWRSRIATYTPNIIDGVVEGFFAVVTDITELKEKSRKLIEQSDYYLGILNSMAEAYVVQDLENHIISFNKSACDILGLSEDQLNGRTSMDPRWQSIHEDGSLFPGDNHPANITIRTGKSIRNVTMGIKTPEGKTKWLKVSSVPFYSNFEGKSAAALCTFSDMTAQIEQKKTTAAIIQNAPGVIYQARLTSSGKLVFDHMNENVLSYFGLRAEEFIKSPATLWKIVAADDKESLEIAIQESAENLSVFKWRGKLKDQSGKEVWISAQSIPHLSPKCEVIWDGIMMDITREVEMEKTLNEERVKAAHSAKLASLGELSAGIAHEINNPLQVIVGMCGMLLTSHQDQSKFEYRVDKIEKAVEKISKIVNGLKRFSRNDSHCVHESNSMASILNEALILAQIKSKRTGTQLRINVTSDSNILCDPLEIEQVVINLINNAIDAVERLEEKWVELQCYDQKTDVVVRVIDSGRGIPTQNVKKLFDPFFTTKSAGKGTGLGLSISNGIINAHGGNLSVVCEHPNTCFEFRIPRYESTIERNSA